MFLKAWTSLQLPLSYLKGPDVFKEKIMLNNVLTSIQRPGRVFIGPDVFRAPTLSLIKGPDVLTATTLLTSFKEPYVYSRDRTSIYWQGCIFIGSASIFRPLRLYIGTYVYSKARTSIQRPGRILKARNLFKESKFPALLNPQYSPKIRQVFHFKTQNGVSYHNT